MVWEIRNQTPFATQCCFVRDLAGAEHWVVAVRALFVFRADGLVGVVDDQPPVLLVPARAGREGREMLSESDFMPFRPRADVIFAGAACAPGGVAARSCYVRVKVGALEKRARVFGRRYAYRHGSKKGALKIEHVEDFGSVPLSWRASLGGSDPFATPGSLEAEPHPFNPLGRGWTAAWPALPGDATLELPLIESAVNPIRVDAFLPSPHGFGPIQPAWQPRLNEAGTYDDAWRAKRAPLLPEDFSAEFFQAAPRDQVYPGELRGSEPVEIEGLHPDGSYQARLPQIILDVTTRIGVRRVAQRPRLIGVTIDGSAKTLSMVWNTALPCNGEDDRIATAVVSVQQMAGVAR